MNNLTPYPLSVNRERKKRAPMPDLIRHPGNYQKTHVVSDGSDESDRSDKSLKRNTERQGSKCVIPGGDPDSNRRGGVKENKVPLSFDVAQDERD